MGEAAIVRHDPVLNFGEALVHLDGDFVSLTDLWRAAGANPNKKPVEWLSHDGTKEFVSCVAATTKVAQDHFEAIRTVRGGNNPGTWGHWQVALAYARYLSPKFHVRTNEIIRAYLDGRLAAAPANNQVIALLQEQGRTVNLLVEQMAALQADQAHLRSVLAKVEAAAANPERFDSRAELGDSENRERAREIKRLMHRAADVLHVHFGRIEGVCRVEYQVLSWKKLPWRLWDAWEKRLHALIDGSDKLPPRVRRAPPAADSRQGLLPFRRNGFRKLPPNQPN